MNMHGIGFKKRCCAKCNEQEEDKRLITRKSNAKEQEKKNFF
jgi:hypothetical protein